MGNAQRKLADASDHLAGNRLDPGLDVVDNLGGVDGLFAAVGGLTAQNLSKMLQKYSGGCRMLQKYSGGCRMLQKHIESRGAHLDQLRRLAQHLIKAVN